MSEQQKYLFDLASITVLTDAIHIIYNRKGEVTWQVLELHRKHLKHREKI